MTTIEVNNKNILVTGGASGIGRQLVRTLSKFNTVYVVDRDGDKLQELKMECPERIIPLACDLSDWDQTRRVLENGLPEVVHGCVNNAGIGAAGSFLVCTEEALDKVLAVNTRAIVNISQVIAQRIINFNEKQTDQGDKVMGSVVNISSLASKFPTRVSLAYNISKAAVDMLTKAMALELGPHNIRVNSVNPIMVMGTDLAKAAVSTGGSQTTDALLARTPPKRFVEISDVVNTVIFLLASDQVKMIHGDSILIDGGYSVM